MISGALCCTSPVAQGTATSSSAVASVELESEGEDDRGRDGEACGVHGVLTRGEEACVGVRGGSCQGRGRERERRVLFKGVDV